MIFDVDGTLYDQSALRRKMVKALLLHYLFRPQKYKELLILYHFRKEREKRPGYTSFKLNKEQYEWCAQKTRLPAETVEKVVSYWMYEFPLKFLPALKYEAVTSLFSRLQNKNIKIAAYSDFPVSEKLCAMQLYTNISVCSTDPLINSFKPSPNGINYILNTLHVKKEHCLFIGDRYSRDGKCAKNAGIRYLILPDSNNEKNKLFVHLSRLLN